MQAKVGRSRHVLRTGCTGAIHPWYKRRVLFAPSDHQEAEQLVRLIRTNPFLPDRIAREREILGTAFVDETPVWSLHSAEETQERKNVEALEDRVTRLVRKAQAVRFDQISDAEWGLYEELAQYHLYYAYEDRLYQAILKPSKDGRNLSFYDDFHQDYLRMFPADGARSSVGPEVLFAWLWQLRRAFHFTFRRILGASLVSAQLRASVWESVFTRDLARYRRGLYARMHDIPTLITGPSGTGKELVAQAIGCARYIPFDGQARRFTEDFREVFQPLHLAALPASLVESELFGHEKGAFTGALAARPGFLEGRSEAHTVFLDEIGEVEPLLQIKLLRVLQTRTFTRVGDNQPRRFLGKIIAATHRDLGRSMREGFFREDFYYRLCADHIRTPSLAEQLNADGAELRRLVAALSFRWVQAEEREAFTEEVLQFVEGHLGLDYPWPGNIRELEQCIKSVLVRGEYAPVAQAPLPQEGWSRLWADARSGELSADQILTRYCTWVYHQVGSYEGAARRLQLDRRTVKRHVDPNWLSLLREEV